MSTEINQKEEVQSPQLEEAYWQALLTEGEYAKSAYPEASVVEPSFSNHRDIYDDHHLSEIELYPEETSEQDWIDIELIMENDEALDLPVIGCNRGGLLVEWRTLRGFVPASQLVSFPASNNPLVRRNALLDRVGDTLHLRVIELVPEKNRLILSERAAQVRQGKRYEILHRLNAGDITYGFVTNLCDFGAFVDLGGVEGLIHISELSWGRVGHPADMLERGQEVKVYVLDLDPDAARIALSLKRLHPDPWETVSERYHINQVVEGRITNVVDFGAFARIEDGLEGLVHFSELAEGHFLHPRNVVAEGDLVQARILSIDAKARRLGLSLRLV